LDYSLALVSRGSLTVATNGSATVASGNVTIAWSDNSGVGDAAQTDKYTTPQK